MLGTTAGLGEHREHVGERLLELRRDVGGVKTLPGVPAHLSGDEHDAPGRHGDAVGIADGRRPALR